MTDKRARAVEEAGAHAGENLRLPGFVKSYVAWLETRDVKL
jgi:hypothetical protein